MIAIKVDLIDADDADDTRDTSGVSVADGCSKEGAFGLLFGSWRLWIEDLRGFDALCQKADTAVDLAQAPLAVLVVGVFAAVTVACGPCHHLDDCRAVFRLQVFALIEKAPKPGGGDVVLAVHGCRLLELGSSCVSLPHGLAPELECSEVRERRV